MTIATTGSNTTGTRGLVAVDKVGNKIRFYDPETIREIAMIEGPEQCVHELAVNPEHTWACVPLYGDGIYGGNKNPNNKVLVLDLLERRIADIITLGREYVAPHGMVAVGGSKLRSKVAAMDLRELERRELSHPEEQRQSGLLRVLWQLAGDFERAFHLHDYVLVM